MPLKLHAGLSKKVGLPGYGSLGASCHVEIELDASLFARSPEEFQQHVQQAFGACAAAVQSELDRQMTPPEPPPGNLGSANGHSGNNQSGNGQTSDGQTRNGLAGCTSIPAAAPAPAAAANHHGQNGHAGRGRGARRRATASQVRAIFAIGHRLQLDVAGELQQRFQVGRPEDLSIGDASHFIDELQKLNAAAGGTR